MTSRESIRCQGPANPAITEQIHRTNPAHLVPEELPTPQEDNHLLNIPTGKDSWRCLRGVEQQFDGIGLRYFDDSFPVFEKVDM